jgi:hypothetical protein
VDRRSRLRLGVVAVVAVLSGCETGPPAPATVAPSAAAPNVISDEVTKAEILKNVLRLVEAAATSPGGRNVEIAAENLNQYFEATDRADFALEPEARAFLEPQLQTTPIAVRSLEEPQFTDRDARHIEDCLLYHTVARRVAGTGASLERVRRVFDWTARHVALVPANSLTPPGLPQVPARPYDVLIRGMATEHGGSWAERAWVFIALCRQIGVDVGLVQCRRGGSPEPVVWACAALVDGRAYLFDARIGREVPGPDGRGVATLDQAVTDPTVLGQLDLPGQFSYSTLRAVLAAAPLTILIDSSPGYLSPRMRLLQRDLAGRNRIILHRDPLEQRAAFAQAMGDRLAGVALWTLPLQVEHGLSHDSQFVAATRYPLWPFDPQLPLLGARLAHLRGDFPTAVHSYVSLRFAEGATLLDGRTPIPPEAQHALDAYATYFLALCHLEQGNAPQAEFLFNQALKLVPAPRPGLPFTLFGWGAHVNLGLLSEQAGDLRGAIGYYCRPDPTPQRLGNLLRATALLWRDPTAPPAEPPPPSPSPAETSSP